MGRFIIFVMGVLVGAGLMYGSLMYHVIRAEDGLHAVPKLTAGFPDTYVDVRQFGFAEWNEHKNLAMALVKAEKSDLLHESVADQFRMSFDQMLNSFGDFGN